MITHDLSESRRELEDQFLDLFEYAPVAYVEFNQDGVIERVNRALCRLLGYEAKEMLGKSYWSFVAGGEEAASRAAVREKLSGLLEHTPVRRKCVTRNGAEVTVEGHDRVIRDSTGRATGLRAALIDVSAVVIAENRLIENGNWLKTVLRSVSEALVALDALGAVVLVNASAERLIGKTEDEAIGMGLEEVLCLSELHGPDWSAPSLVARFRRSLVEEWSGRALLHRQGGEPIQVQVCSTPIIDQRQQVAGVVLNLKECQSARPNSASLLSAAS